MTNQTITRIMAGLALIGALGVAGQAALAARPAPGAPAPTTPRAAGDWPMYGHDISRTNYNPDETLIAEGNVGQLTQRWQYTVGSNGTPASSSPSVANGRVYVGSSAATGNNFFAVDAISGTGVWSTTVGYVSSCFNVGIGATPAISGSLVVAGGGDSAYYGLDADTGAQRWRNTMDVGPSGFAWASPLINGNRVYVGMASRCDNPSVRGEVRAIDATTGVSATRQFFVPAGQAGGGIWNSPVMSADRSVLAVATGEDYGGYNGPYNRAIVSLDPASLGIIGFHQQGATGQDLDYGTTPVIFHDSQGRALIGANHKNGVFYTYVLNNINAGPIWNRSTGTSVGMMPAYDPTFGAGGTLFIYGSGGRVYAVDPATGADRWPSAVTPGSAHGNMAVANGLLFFNLGSGGVQIRRESDGTLLRTLTPPGAGASNAGIAVSNGFIYWVAGSYLNAWSLPAGAPTPTPAPPTATGTAVPTSTAPAATATSTAPAPTATLPAPTVTPGAPSATPQPPTATYTPGGPSATPAPPTATQTPAGPTATAAPPSATSTPCAVSFSDVHPSDYFYTPVQYLTCHGVISGYADGTFRPYNNTTRSQMVKIVVNAFAVPAYAPPGGGYTFADVPPANPFFVFIEAAAHGNIVSGYACGGTGEPCDAQNRPYFRPYANVTRGQLSKIVVVAANWTVVNPAGGSFADVLPNTAFYTFVETAYCHGVISGYTCGGPGEPCDSASRPYFRQFNDATRGQIAKIVYNALTAGAACAP